MMSLLFRLCVRCSLPLFAAELNPCSHSNCTFTPFSFIPHLFLLILHNRYLMLIYLFFIIIFSSQETRHLSVKAHPPRNDQLSSHHRELSSIEHLSSYLINFIRYTAHSFPLFSYFSSTICFSKLISIFSKDFMLFYKRS